MFQTIVVKPIYNILVAIYGVLPGHDLGVSLILFTVLIRVLLWPLLQKQLRSSRIMREMQPELAKIKKAAGGDRQKEGQLIMELYKEKGINPLGTFAITLIQLPVFLGVFQAARKLTEHTDEIGLFTYSFVEKIPHISSVIASGGEKFNFISLGFIDLSRQAFNNGSIYIPVFVIAALATVFQFFQAKQLMPQQKEKKRLRDILKTAQETGKQASAEDISAATGSSMLFLMPILTIMFAIAAQGAMVMYLLTTSIVGIVQQTIILRKDKDELEDKAEVVSVKKTPLGKVNKAKKSAANSKSTSASSEKDGGVVEKINKGKVTTKTRIITPGQSTQKKGSAKKSQSKKKGRKR